MTDYRKMPLGPMAPDRIGEIVECPHCHERGLKVEDFKDPDSGSFEKETVYVHVESGLRRQMIEHGRTVYEFETIVLACPIKMKPH